MVDYPFPEGAFANGELVRTGDLNGIGLNSRNIAKLVGEGKLMRLRRGIYEWTTMQSLTDLELITKLIPDGIMCLNSALYCHGYSSRTPEEWEIAVDRNTNRKRLNLEYPIIRIHYTEPKLLDIGMIQTECFGAIVRVYDKERTICDVLRAMGRMDREIFNNAIVSYARDKEKNVRNLIAYSKHLRIYKRVQEVIGPWL